MGRLANARDNTAKRILKVGFLRRWYARRLLKFIDKSKRKKRDLPDHLQRLDQLTRKVPANKRVEAVEELLTPGREGQFGREMRRAAARQDRNRGSRGGGKRPGMPPQQVVKRVKR